MELDLPSKFVMSGLVPGIHVLATIKQERRGWPGRSPAMTKNESNLRGVETTWKCRALFASVQGRRPGQANG